MKISKYRFRATVDKWIGKGADMWLTIAIVVALIILIVAAFTVSISHGHGIHLSDNQDTMCPVVASGWVEGGYILATDCDGDADADHFWKVHKHYDLKHVALHLIPLSKGTAAKILLLQGLSN